MTRHSLESVLAYFTLGALVVYIPLETWYSIPHGLLHPMYLVDVVAMVLMLGGALLSLRARPHASPGVLAAGWAWAAANGWRATAWRYLEVSEGGGLEHGRAELIATGVGTAVALVCLSVALYLASRRPR